MKKAVIGIGLTGIGLTINGCGGGGGPTPAPGPPGPGPAPGPPPPGPPVPKGCSEYQYQCVSCSDGKCNGCKNGYVSDTSVKGGRCIAACIGKNATALPARPSTPFDLNGKAWPPMCLDHYRAHFFGIGDWGGDGDPGHTWTNPGRCAEYPGQRGRPCQDSDHWAQKYVANQMKKKAPDSKPDYVLNVGDNFYPGGITQKCGTNGSHPGLDPTGQWEAQFNKVYGGPGMTGKPWFSVLGNHDYGGYQWNLGWDQQIFATWDRKDWVMPGQFWSRKVQYKDFAVQYFFLDSNFVDSHIDKDPNHNLCQKAPAPFSCWKVTQQNCDDMFMAAWKDGQNMMKNVLQDAEHDAEWNIIVTHFPPPTVFAEPVVKDLNEKYGIDLIITGHTHFQETGVDKASGIPWIITGGGGGVTTDSSPVPDGHDDAYGFVDFTIDRTTLKFDMYTWGGDSKDGKQAPNPDMVSEGSHTIIAHKEQKEARKAFFAAQRAEAATTAAPKATTAAPVETVV